MTYIIFQRSPNDPNNPYPGYGVGAGLRSAPVPPLPCAPQPAPLQGGASRSAFPKTGFVISCLIPCRDSQVPINFTPQATAVPGCYAPLHSPALAPGFDRTAAAAMQNTCTRGSVFDCLAARLPGTLTELEEVVAEAEQSRSLMAVADLVRSDAVELPGAMRWVRRRVVLVQHRSEAGDRPVVAAVRLPSRGHRLSPAPRQRCGVGIATVADCPLAPRCGRAARFPPPRHRS